MSSVRNSGKTAPRLIHDLLDYDPAHSPPTGRNLLSEVPPVYPAQYQGPPHFISPSACRHDYATKPEQSIRPPEGVIRGSSATPTKISATCSQCRYHLQLKVTANTVGKPVQSFSDHMHHLTFYHGKYRGGQEQEEITAKGQAVETFDFQCSYPTCAYRVSIRVASPLLSDDMVRLLTDTELLRKRTDEALASDPERLEGVARPQPITVLMNLRTYVDNALRNNQQSKSISAVNKRFMTSFGVGGQPCQDLFEFLGFTYKSNGFWDPPRPNPWAEKPYQDPQKIFLDDIFHELSALISQRPLAEKKGNQDEHTLKSAFNDLLYAVDSFDYPKAPRLHEFQMAPAPYYEDLGVVEDMLSSSVIEAFSRQVTVDPARAPGYLQCLKEIGKLRGGDDAEAINRAVEMAYAEGNFYTDADVVEAYKYFGLTYDDPRLTEDSVIGTFYNYLSSTTQETETRRQLWRIGDSRKSERIKSAAEDRVATPEQAQVFLGVTSDTADDFVMTMFTAKVNDNPSCRDVARRAVELIAKARGSDALKHFVKTGEMTAGEMDVSDAYLLLQIPDRTADEGAIMAAYTICVDEAPAQAEKYNKALAILAKETNSALLSSMVPGMAGKPDRDLSKWPVGLQNIGNTCYLNSLLQFYFSIRPYRNMVLDFENFRMELDDESCQKKQVGSRKVSKKEVERSQRFLRELRGLFSDMISSPDSFVTPGQELARLTLISPSNEAAIRRRSTISAGQFGGLGELNGMPVLGPLGPPHTIPEENRTAALAEQEKIKSSGDEDSEATLVSDSVKNENPPAQSDDKENAPPKDDAVMVDASNKPEHKETQGSDKPVAAAHEGPSNKPPPVPPRPTPQVDPQRQLMEEVEIGAQQDVTEVINNVLFQSQCAIRPLGIAPDGEQLDQVKDLFYGQAISYILSNKGQRSKEERWCDIKIDVATGPRDIYSAIDGAFDIQKVNVEDSVAEQYATISKLPPILQIQVQRVQFDSVKKRSFKSTHHLDLKETIYLDRYMDTRQAEILNRRKQCWEWKDTLRKLEARRAELERQTESDGLSTATLLNSARDILNDLNEMKENPDTARDAIDVDPQLVPELNRLAQEAQDELKYLEQEIKNTQTLISSQFVDYKHLPYRLYAVFVHHGSVEFGHYYIYIFDFERNVWRKYNDTYVTEVRDLDEIFKSTDRHNPPTPYFLVYVNDRIKDRLVSPVSREIVETVPESAPEPVPSDATAMEGVSPSKVPDNVTMDLPAYDEVYSGNGASGEGAASEMKEREKSVPFGHSITGSWTSDGADKRDGKW
ncbi:ubiquitin-specific protease UBP2 [Aspergillus undulatus]|uniref:ubiquitin-specific protease UBP2 n=1 Tax=Aspergillus undulatus TaxID=1810928 RepID=UPI003CCD937A